MSSVVIQVHISVHKQNNATQQLHHNLHSASQISQKSPIRDVKSVSDNHELL